MHTVKLHLSASLCECDFFLTSHKQYHFISQTPALSPSNQLYLRLSFLPSEYNEWRHQYSNEIYQTLQYCFWEYLWQCLSAWGTTVNHQISDSDKRWHLYHGFTSFLYITPRFQPCCPNTDICENTRYGTYDAYFNNKDFPCAHI